MYVSEPGGLFFLASPSLSTSTFRSFNNPRFDIENTSLGFRLLIVSIVFTILKVDVVNTFSRGRLCRETLSVDNPICDLQPTTVEIGVRLPVGILLLVIWIFFSFELYGGMLLRSFRLDNKVDLIRTIA